MEKVDSMFVCGVCFQVLEDPVRHVGCGKVFCAGCLNVLLCQNCKAACPNCRLEIFQEDLLLDLQVEIEIGMGKVVCDCGISVVCREFNRHLDECQAYKESFKMVTVKPKEKVINRWTFKCPACELKNLDRKLLVEHFLKMHRGVSGVCPICSAMPWGDSSYVSVNLSGHLKTRHNMDYDTLTVFFM